MTDPKMVKLGERQRTKALHFIRQHIKKKGYPPTHAEVAQHLGVTRQAVASHLRVLEEQGYIVITQGVARGIRIR